MDRLALTKPVGGPRTLAVSKTGEWMPQYFPNRERRRWLVRGVSMPPGRCQPRAIGPEPSRTCRSPTRPSGLARPRPCAQGDARSRAEGQAPCRGRRRAEGQAPRRGPKDRRRAGGRRGRRTGAAPGPKDRRRAGAEGQAPRRGRRRAEGGPKDRRRAEDSEGPNREGEARRTLKSVNV